jgi:hypothetical protein
MRCDTHVHIVGLSDRYKQIPTRTYLASPASLEGLQAATRRPEGALCRACLTREYPTRVPTATGKLRFEPV